MALSSNWLGHHPQGGDSGSSPDSATKYRQLLKLFNV